MHLSDLFHFWLTHPPFISSGAARIIMGGEVDCAKGCISVSERPLCINSHLEHYTGQTSSMMELKTSMIIRSPRDEVNFER